MIRVMIVGLGAIGLGCARAIQVERDMSLVGLVDSDAAKVGRLACELADDGRGDREREAGLRIVADVEEVMAGKPQVAVLTMTSRFDEQAALIEWLLQRQVAVVSSCEQMLWPWYAHQALAGRVDRTARRAGRAALGTGVNPGFVMDTLAVTMSSMVRRVSMVRCLRRVDASLRRAALQAKVGVTLSIEAFEDQVRRGTVGHAGLVESLALLGAGLNRQVAPGAVEQTIEPVVAERCMPSALGLIEAGKVAGVHQVARWEGRKMKLELDLTMAVGMEDPRDVVRVEGPVSIACTIPGGVPGDSATVAALLNHIPMVHEAAGGLRTMLDLPPSGCVYHGR